MIKNKTNDLTNLLKSTLTSITINYMKHNPSTCFNYQRYEVQFLNILHTIQNNIPILRPNQQLHLYNKEK